MVYYERRGFAPTNVEKININKAYELAEKVLEADRIDPRKLKHCDQQMVDRDMQYVRDRKAQFEKESTPESKEDKKMATILEAIIHEQVELGDWLGPDAETIASSSYDDIANGVDSIVKLRHEGEGDTHLGLAIDVTFSTDIRGKLNKIMQDIEMGKLTEIKYLPLPDSEAAHEYAYKGSSKMPRVVVGIERQVAEKLADLWLKKNKENKKELGNHPVQHVIAKEILDQLAVSEQYARSHGNRNNIAAVYRQVSMVIERSLKEKEDGGNYANGLGSLKNDKVLHTITQYLDDIMIAMK